MGDSMELKSLDRLWANRAVGKERSQLRRLNDASQHAREEADLLRQRDAPTVEEEQHKNDEELAGAEQREELVKEEKDASRGLLKADTDRELSEQRQNSGLERDREFGTQSDAAEDDLQAQRKLRNQVPGQHAINRFGARVTTKESCDFEPRAVWRDGRCFVGNSGESALGEAILLEKLERAQRAHDVALQSLRDAQEGKAAAQAEIDRIQTQEQHLLDRDDEKSLNEVSAEDSAAHQEQAVAANNEHAAASNVARAKKELNRALKALQAEQERQVQSDQTKIKDLEQTLKRDQTRAAAVESKLQHLEKTGKTPTAKGAKQAQAVQLAQAEDKVAHKAVLKDRDNLAVTEEHMVQKKMEVQETAGELSELAQVRSGVDPAACSAIFAFLSLEKSVTGRCRGTLAHGGQSDQRCTWRTS